MAQLKNTTINDTGFLQLPTGTTAQRPTSAAAGQMRYNTNTNSVESYDTAYNAWFPAGVISPVATGGTVTNISQGGVNYRVHTFTSVGTSTFTVSRAGPVEFLIVAGGGGGGMDMGGGGGGGGVLQGFMTLLPRAYTVVVGQQGYGAPRGGGGFRTDGAGPQPNVHQFTIPATSGSNSSAFGFTALGGGHGGSSVYTFTPGASGNSGGSGGGASGYSNDGTLRASASGTPGQGNSGGRGGPAYYSGGGGGAGGPGTGSPAIPHGGVGISSAILGTMYFWAGGGGGAAYSVSPGGNGGLGGGGGGAVGVTIGGAGLNNGSAGGGGSPNAQTNTPGGSAGANTGGGGGGGAHYRLTNQGGEGGSGIVVVRYRTS